MVAILIIAALVVLADAVWDAWHLQQSTFSGDGWEVFSALHVEYFHTEEEALNAYRQTVILEAASLAVRAFLAVGVLGYFY